MSYRAFKNLLGENNLERKCRLLLGGGILVLMTLSFWLYARETEDLAYKQTGITGKLLVPSILAKLHTEPDKQAALKEFQDEIEKTWPNKLNIYTSQILKPKAVKPEHKPDGLEVGILNDFLEHPEKFEESRSNRGQNAVIYYAPIRATPSCIDCHTKLSAADGGGPVAVNDLMAVIRMTLSTEAIEEGVNQNRATLISAALVTSLLIMAGSYLIIRYVIVKPLKHLKEVSDAIADGRTNVRAEIQTGDEFEDLSVAFNRMLRKLMDMREEASALNADLDKKVDDLGRANMALHNSDRIKGDFLATMSHELRTPLNSILGFSDVLLTNAGSLSEKQARWISNIKSNGQQLLNLINDILDLAKIESGRMEVRGEEISLSEMGDGLMVMFRPLAEKKRIELRTRYEAPLPLVRQDGLKLRQILSNLLSNAVKFSPEGGWVQLRAEVKEDRLILTVSDNGTGIAPADQEVIFEKFRQSGSILTREHEGSGLGLSIVHELCKLLGGTISLKSELGRGSSFTVTLPTSVPDGSRYDFSLSDAVVARRRVAGPA